MGKSFRSKAWVSGACLALATALSVVPAADAPTVTETELRQAFDFELEDINPRSDTYGQKLSVSRLYAKQGLVLQFIASWCKPCRDELPDLERLYLEQGAPIVLVAADESGYRESVLIVAERNGLTTPILFAPEDRVAEIEANYTYEILPATYFIDRQGTIRHAHEGAMGAERLARAISTELGP